MSDYYSPTGIANLALDAAGIDFTLGDIEEGTKEAQVCLRAYTPCVRQLLRTANWDWARKEAPLNLVADASGQTPGIGTLVPSGFLYSYNLPLDSLKVRFIPANNWAVDLPIPPQNIVPPDSGAPLTTGTGQPPWAGNPVVPSRFLITSDPNYVPEGSANDLPGISPIGQTIICSNIQSARCVYTFNASYPNLFDELFRSALVAYLASEIALPLSRDKKFGLTMRKENVAIAQAKIQHARATNGNETWANSDLSVDWMQIRISGRGCGAWGNNWGAGPGYLFGGYDDIGWGTGNTSAY